MKNNLITEEELATVATPEFRAYLANLERHGAMFWKETEDRSALDRAKRMVELAQDLVTFCSSQIPPEMPRIACQKGCAHCCTIRVDVAVWEAEALIEPIVVQGAAVVSAWMMMLHQRALQVSSLDSQGYRALEIKCPFLTEENTCCVYPIRPIACISWHSLRREDCAEAERKKAGTTPYYPHILLPPNAFRNGIIKANGESPVLKELHLALYEALCRRIQIGGVR